MTEWPAFEVGDLQAHPGSSTDPIAARPVRRPSLFISASIFSFDIPEEKKDVRK